MSKPSLSLLVVAVVLLGVFIAGCSGQSTPTPEPTNAPAAAPTVTPTPKPTNTPAAAPTATPTPEPTNAPAVTSTATPMPEPTNAPAVTPTATPMPEPTNAPAVTPTATPTSPGRIEKSRAILSFNRESFDAFLTEFSGTERSCFSDNNVGDDHLRAIQVLGYRISVPEEISAQFIQCLGDETLLRLLFSDYQGLPYVGYEDDYFGHLSDGTWECIRAGFGALEISDMVASDPTIFSELVSVVEVLTTPCLSDEEWDYLLQTGQESEDDADNLEKFRCLADEYEGVQGMGAEMKYVMENPELQDNPDERFIVFLEAAGRCGFETE